MTSERPHETLFDIFDKEKKEQNGKVNKWKKFEMNTLAASPEHKARNVELNMVDKRNPCAVESCLSASARPLPSPGM